jgi:glycine amidinotransferase/scyllo-inosamine-4-phosphate amidinotransferase 1
VIEETEEDLNLLAIAFQNLGIKVKRPLPIDHRIEFSTMDWKTNGFYSYCPRDSILVVGDKIIETPMTMRSRFLEQFAFKDTLLEYFKEGGKWFSAPKPRLLDSAYSLNPTDISLNNFEPIFDAANVLKAGQDLFYLVSNTGNELGAKWLSSVLGNDYNVNICRGIYNGIHIDSTIALLRPGLVLLNPSRIKEATIPDKLKKWDKIWCPDLVDSGFAGKRPLSSIWVGMNLFMINPHLAVVSSEQKKLIILLEQNKIDVIPLKLRHSRTLGGGFHCVTLDTKRNGILENYF